MENKALIHHLQMVAVEKQLFETGSHITKVVDLARGRSSVVMTDHDRKHPHTLRCKTN
jgi:hypothetical protein